MMIEVNNYVRVVNSRDYSGKVGVISDADYITGHYDILFAVPTPSWKGITRTPAGFEVISRREYYDELLRIGHITKKEHFKECLS